ncbi:hypothetical protein ACOME3_006144 [Neoechinorhynchus agilis]
MHQSIDTGPEIANTISHLSLVLSYFDQDWNDVRELVQSIIRRSLCVSIVRNWNFSQKVLKCTVRFLWEADKNSLNEALHDLRAIFSSADKDVLSALNDLFIDDYLKWIEENQLDFGILKSLAVDVANLDIKKSDFEDLNLIEMDCLAAFEKMKVV